MIVHLGRVKQCPTLEVGDKYDDSVVSYIKQAPIGKFLMDKNADGSFTVTKITGVEIDTPKVKKTVAPEKVETPHKEKKDVKVRPYRRNK